MSSRKTTVEMAKDGRGCRKQTRDLKENETQTHLSVKSDDASSSSIASSSSSTLQGTQSPPDKTSPKITVDERTTLLNTSHEAPSHAQRAYHRLYAFLMYQPAPIPAITSTLNVLPDQWHHPAHPPLPWPELLLPLLPHALIDTNALCLC